MKKLRIDLKNDINEYSRYLYMPYVSEISQSEFTDCLHVKLTIPMSIIDYFTLYNEDEKVEDKSAEEVEDEEVLCD